MENNHVILNDKRKLGYSEYGIKDGYPIIYCHGSQSSRLEMHYDLSFAVNNKLRIISMDRPGHGDSDFNPNGSILSFANDTNQLIEKLGIKEFSVLGMSAGAPFAMGIANLLKQKTKKLGIVSGFAPINNETNKALSKEVSVLLKMAKSFPIFLKLMLKIQHRQLKKNPKSALKNFLKIMSAPDQEILKNESVMNIIERMFKEAFKNGSKGVYYEISKILVQDWKFQMSDIRIPTFIWHGSDDNNVPKEWAMMTNKEIQNSQLKIFPNEGHLIIFKNAEEIFTTLKKNEKEKISSLSKTF